MDTVEFLCSGVRLVGSATGPEDGIPLLFLHGGGQTHMSWRGALGEAARRGYRAIAIDLRGHGDSEWSPDGYGTARFADDVAQVAAKLDRPVLIGASLGGLAGLLATTDPRTNARGMILVDVSVRLETEGTDEIVRFMHSAPEGFASLDDAADAVSAYLPHRPRPVDHSGLARNLRLRPDGRLYWHWDPAFIQGTAGRPDQKSLDDAARKLAIPTLLVRGQLSRVLSHAGVEAFLELAPHAHFADIAGADHMVAGDANDAFSRVIFDFLDRNYRAS